MVIVEQRRKRIMDVSLELLGGGRELANKLGKKLVAVLVGYHIGPLAKELIAYGADRVYLIDALQLELYQSDAYAIILADLIVRYKPEIVLLGATSIGTDLASRVAAKLQTGLTAHCVNLTINAAQQLVQTVPGWGGNVMVNCLCKRSRPQMATVRLGVMEKQARDSGRTGEVVRVEVEVKESDCRAKTLEMVEREPEETTIEKANIIVAAGFGLCSTENFRLLENFGKVLGGTVAGTRPAVDKGWIPQERMIGSSGRIVKPQLYIGAGISGATHHTVGIMNSKIIVAINNDPRAPIFEVADFGIVGDVREVLPCLIKEFEKTLDKT